MSIFEIQGQQVQHGKLVNVTYKLHHDTQPGQSSSHMNPPPAFIINVSGTFFYYEKTQTAWVAARLNEQHPEGALDCFMVKIGKTISGLIPINDEEVSSIRGKERFIKQLISAERTLQQKLMHESRVTEASQQHSRLNSLHEKQIRDFIGLSGIERLQNNDVIEDLLNDMKMYLAPQHINKLPLSQTPQGRPSIGAVHDFMKTLFVDIVDDERLGATITAHTISSIFYSINVGELNSRQTVKTFRLDNHQLFIVRSLANLFLSANTINRDKIIKQYLAHLTEDHLSFYLRLFDQRIPKTEYQQQIINDFIAIAHAQFSTVDSDSEEDEPADRYESCGTLINEFMNLIFYYAHQRIVEIAFMKKIAQLKSHLLNHPDRTAYLKSLHEDDAKTLINHLSSQELDIIIGNEQESTLSEIPGILSMNFLIKTCHVIQHNIHENLSRLYYQRELKKVSSFSYFFDEQFCDGFFNKRSLRVFQEIEIRLNALGLSLSTTLLRLVTRLPENTHVQELNLNVQQILIMILPSILIPRDFYKQIPKTYADELLNHKIPFFYTPDLIALADKLHIAKTGSPVIDHVTTALNNVKTSDDMSLIMYDNNTASYLNLRKLACYHPQIRIPRLYAQLNQLLSDSKDLSFQAFLQVLSHNLSILSKPGCESSLLSILRYLVKLDISAEKFISALCLGDKPSYENFYNALRADDKVILKRKSLTCGTFISMNEERIQNLRKQLTHSVNELNSYKIGSILKYASAEQAAHYLQDEGVVKQSLMRYINNIESMQQLLIFLPLAEDDALDTAILISLLNLYLEGKARSQASKTESPHVSVKPGLAPVDISENDEDKLKELLKLFFSETKVEQQWHRLSEAASARLHMPTLFQ